MGYGISNSKKLAECDRKANTVRFLRSPRRAKGTRGHNPDNQYATWRSPMREARRKIGWLTGRQWVKFRKFGQKMYRKMQDAKTMGGMIDNAAD